MNGGVFFPRRVLILVYVIVGIVIASNHHYFTHLGTWRQVLSAVLGVLLWPLILLGISLHIHR